MSKLIDNQTSTYLDDFVHENSLDSLEKQIDVCMKEQRDITTIIFLSRRCQNKSITQTIDSSTQSVNDSIEIYDCHINPTYWKGTKSVIISLNNITKQKLKQKLMENQSNEINTQFYDVIDKLEQEISTSDEKKKYSNKQLIFMKNILFTTTKLYNDFLFIKNVIEIDCNDMRTELEIFSIKDFLIYSIELLLSKTKECKVNLIIDPCLPEEVEGDLCKFRQIITALLDFSLKSTETVEIKVDVHFKREYEGYNIDFRISLYPKFELKQEDLQLLIGESSTHKN